ncbi:DUF6517 family protein [Natrinema halophilum]|uniref:Uncharacterized protein n=1 Tax=Natrinema halophilum TaxID=1699371 RepID=A0A7D5KZI1_9EURY|nr:DUF6517 family protein [Natrinema halophilum]QLG49280.1 DUF6517 family protein [Natrinema halophilum]
MPRERHRVGADGERTLSRRTVLAAAATSAAALAGCTDELTEHEFEATPVGLPEDGRQEIVLGESGRDASTITLEVEQIDGEVIITSHTVAYTREQAYAHPDDFPALTDAVQPWMLGQFLGGVNGTEGPGSAVVVSGRDLGIDELTLPMFEEEPTIPGRGWSLVVPAGARTDGEVSLEETVALVPGTAFPGSEWVPGNEWFPGSEWVPGNEWFPGSEWVPGNEWFPGSEWVPGNEWVPDDPESLQVMLTTRDPETGALFDFIGSNYDDRPGRPLDEGEVFETGDSVLAVSGAEVLSDTEGTVFNPKNGTNGAYYPLPAGELFNQVVAPTGGATYGIGVLSTPAAEVAGQSLNPIDGMDIETLLTSDEARGLLGEAGITDADEVEWLQGPEAVAVGGQSPFTLLGEDADQGTFAGVVRGSNGPWGVVANLARVVADDLVVAVGVQRRPLSAEVPASDWLEADGGTEVPTTNWLAGGRELSAASFESLQSDA